MIRIIAAAAIALAVSACAPRPPRYDYAVIFTVPITGAAQSAAPDKPPRRR